MTLTQLALQIADIVSVEVVEEKWSLGVQKPPRWVGQNPFPGACWTAPGFTEKEEIPVGLKTRPVWFPRRAVAALTSVVALLMLSSQPR